jgi:hypothetical protein
VEGPTAFRSLLQMDAKNLEAKLELATYERTNANQINVWNLLIEIEVPTADLQLLFITGIDIELRVNLLL